MAAPDRRLTLNLDPDLAGRLAAAAEHTGVEPADLVLRCLRDHLDEVGAYARVFDEIVLVKGHLAELAALVGEALAEPTPASVAGFCRYKPAKTTTKVP